MDFTGRRRLVTPRLRPVESSTLFGDVTLLILGFLKTLASFSVVVPFANCFRRAIFSGVLLLYIVSCCTLIVLSLWIVFCAVNRR